jgi:hypothetical protein
MKYLRRAIPDIVLFVAVAMALAIAIAGCGARPVFPEGQDRNVLTRTMVEPDGTRCAQALPLLLEDDEWTRAALEAAGPWSKVLGFPVVDIARPDEQPTLVFELRARPEAFPDRVAEHSGRCVGAAYVDTIALFVAGDTVQLYYVIMHELGHALGVMLDYDAYGHSGSEASIMYHSVKPSMQDEGKTSMPHVTDRDAAALRRAWGL